MQLFGVFFTAQVIFSELDDICVLFGLAIRNTMKQRPKTPVYSEVWLQSTYLSLFNDCPNPDRRAFTIALAFKLKGHETCTVNTMKLKYVNVSSAM